MSLSPPAVCELPYLRLQQAVYRLSQGLGREARQRLVVTPDKQNVMGALKPGRAPCRG
jgi:hypothetical protein